MKPAILAIVLFSMLCFGQKATIDLSVYKSGKNFSTVETAYTIGAHTFTLVNIRPLHKSDTACISAIVIDKRKYVLFDIGVEGVATGLIVPHRQPISDGLVVIKASPVEGKTFVFLSNGKLVTLPGALAVADTVGKRIYCVWENEKQYRLTVFDYKNVRVVVPTTEIVRPMQWYSNGISLCFSAEQEKGYFTVDMFTKSVSKTETVEGTLTPISYLIDFSKTDITKCCTGQVLKK
jgi:hypothetical protein